MNVSEDFSSRLQSLLVERDISQAELARRLHTQSSTLARWFNGSVPQRNSMKALCEVLKVNELWLAKGKGPRDRHTPSAPSFPSDYSPAEYSGMMREDTVAPSPAEKGVDVKLLIAVLREMADDLYHQPEPKFGTLVGMRAMIAEILPLVKPVPYPNTQPKP